MADEIRRSSCGIGYRIFRSSKAVHCNGNKHLPKVLALHGWMGDGVDLVPLCNRLTNAGLVVFVPDLPFHGSSVQVLANSCDIAAKKVFSSFLDFCLSEEHQLNDGHHCDIHSFSVLLIGYSMGGRIAFEILRLWDHIIGDNNITLAGSVFLSSSLPPKTTDESNLMALREEQARLKLNTFTSASEFEIWLRDIWYSNPMWGNFVRHSNFDSLINRRVSSFNRVQIRSWANASRFMGTSTMGFCSDTFPTPVLYLYGTLDTKYSAMRTEYYRVFEASRCVPIEMCGHNVILERLDLVSRFVVLFLLQRSSICGHVWLSPDSFEYFPYSIPLTVSMSVRNRIVDLRNGFLLKIVLSNGCSGVADVAPLPGWHSISVQKARAEVIASISKLRHLTVCPVCFIPQSLSAVLSTISPLTASAIEAAIIHALARSIGLNLVLYINHLQKIHFGDELKPLLTWPPARAEIEQFISLNGVLPRMVADIERQQALITFVSKSCFKTLKLKVGSATNVCEDVEFVQLAARVAASKQKLLRLDANQSWTMEQWKLFKDGLGKTWSLIEFIEEPLKFENDLRNELCTDARFPKIALDESIAHFSVTDLLSLLTTSNCSALVIKPTMFRSMTQIFRLCTAANTNRKRLIFSSTFESGVGLAWLSSLLFSCCRQTFSSDVHHGLGTYDYLKHDVIEPHFREFCVIQENTIDVERCSEYLERAVQYPGYREIDYDDLPIW